MEIISETTNSEGKKVIRARYTTDEKAAMEERAEHHRMEMERRREEMEQRKSELRTKR